MSDIAFSMTADEKDVVRGLQAVGKATGTLREQIADLVTASKAAGAADNQLSQQRLAALAPILVKQKELKAATAELEKQLKEGKITADQYKTSFEGISKESNTLTTELRQLQAQVNEDSADLKKAGIVIGATEDKTAKYARAVAELDRLKQKGILTSKQHTAAIAAESAKLTETGDAADKSGGFISGLTGKMAGFVGGLGSASAVIALLKSEYDALIERQGKSRDANISLATEQEALLMNLGGADAKETGDQIRDVSKSSGIKEENITRAVNEAMAARGDMEVKDVIGAVSSASKVRKFAPTELATLAASTIDTQKQTGLGTDESLGFLMQLQGQSHVNSLQGTAKNFTPAVGGIMKMGADRQTAGGLLAALSHGMGDSTGEQTKTSGINLAKQLREYGQRGNPEALAQLNNLDKTQATEMAALKADESGSAEDQRLKREALKEQHAAQRTQLQDSAPAVPIAEVIAKMQADPEYRKQFLKGKDQGGFGATFEAAALPVVESLLSGGTSGKNYLNAKDALQGNPLDALNKNIADRGSMSAIGLAEMDQSFGGAIDQIQIGDKAGATSAITRERMKQLRTALGKTSIGTKLEGVIDDVGTGGVQTLDSSIKNVERLKSGMSDQKDVFRSKFQRAGNYDFNVAADRERFNTGFQKEWSQTEAGNQETLLKLLVDELKAMRADQNKNAAEANANNQQKAHAGIVGNRANDREGN